MAKSESTSLSEQLRSAIEQARENGWAVRAIARAAGVPHPVLLRFLSGVTPDLRLETADRLAQHFGMRLTKPKRNITSAPPENGRRKRS